MESVSPYLTYFHGHVVKGKNKEETKKKILKRKLKWEAKLCIGYEWGTP